MTGRVGTVGHLAIGPPEHGVTRYAHDVYRGCEKAEPGRHRFGHVVLAADAVAAASAMQCDLLHIHVTDRIFGTSPESAEARLGEIVRAAGVPVSVTLHDLPQPSDGSTMERRARFYRAVAEVAAGIAVSSEHERALVHAHVHPHATAAVVPLLIEPPIRVRPRTTSGPPTVVVLGFVYPGKGHAEVLAALRDLDLDVGFVALGAPSPGHDDLVVELTKAAVQQHRCFTITGFVPEDRLLPALAAATVPVAHHRHLSASGSINSWVAAGRRPLVARSRYSDELDGRNPGMLMLYDEADLSATIAAAIAEPDSTWLSADTDPQPSPAAVAIAYNQLFRAWSR